MELFNPAVIAVLAVILVIIMVAMLYTRNYLKVPPNQVAVFTGRGKAKTVRGGARFRIPVIERVDYMALEPFNVDVEITGAYSKGNVPVKVTAVALIRFGTEEVTLQSAIERFLTSPRDEMHRQAREILSGNLRGVIANMTIEELNSSREQLAQAVVNEAATSFGKIGMELEVLTIQNISDEDGYLHALGRTRVAEVKRDADIGEAEAARDAQVKSAAAKQAGQTAQAAADTAIAEANRERDLRLAAIEGEVQAETARAQQAGPLATAKASKDVGVAEEEARAAREAAAVDVERRRAERAEEAQKADVLVPAEARRQAAELQAAADRVTTVTQAEAEAEGIRAKGQADAEARTALSAATQAELEAAAAGEKAMLLARADGEKELGDALNSFGSEAARLYLLPDVIKAMPEIAARVAEPLGNIDRIVLIGGNNGDSDGEGGMVQQIATVVPMGIALMHEVIKATTGLDIGGDILAATANGAKDAEAALETASTD